MFVEESVMKFLSKTLLVLFTLAVLGTLGVTGYRILKFLVELVGSVDSQVAAVAAVASVMALLVATTVAYNIRLLGKQGKTHQLHAEKAATYHLFVDAWEALLRQGGSSEDRNPNKVPDDLLALDRLLILYGSPDVLKAHGMLRALEHELGARNPQVRLQFARVLMEVRKDLGLQTQGLLAEDLLRLLFAEADKASAPSKAHSYQDPRPRVSLASSV
jgi:membrane protein required for beta-lactamase induction